MNAILLTFDLASRLRGKTECEIRSLVHVSSGPSLRHIKKVLALVRVSDLLTATGYTGANGDTAQENFPNYEPLDRYRFMELRKSDAVHLHRTCGEAESLGEERRLEGWIGFSSFT